MFAGKYFDKEPDIDLNFSGEVREKIYEYIKQKYGAEKVIYAGTVGTIADKTAKRMIDRYSEDLYINFSKEKEQELIQKLCGIKRTTGVHPGGIIILPKDKDINQYTPIEKYEDTKRKTHIDYHSVMENGIYKFDILSHDTPTMLNRLQKLTGVDHKKIDLNDKETLEIFLNAGNDKYEISTIGIPEFETKYVINILSKVKPKNLNDLICIDALSHGTDTWNLNAQSLIENKNIPVDKVISNRAGMMNYLIENKIERETAFEIAEFIRKGRASRNIYSLWKSTGAIKEREEKWGEYKKILKEHNIPGWYIKSAEKIKYLFPKSHAIGYTINAFKIAWYKVHYPEAFYKVYFDIKGTINVNDYTSKEQVQRKIKRLEEKLDDDNSWQYKGQINELKLIQEMFERNVKKEEKRKLDEYDLINSVAIADHCREIKHRFNTEELAVLVYRNKKMSINEKIEKYKNLIENYPDMEVIERINCEHYDSVKVMIQNEINRLEKLKEKLYKEETDVIYTYSELNKSTRKWDSWYKGIENITKTYTQIEKDIEEYIEEYNDTIAYDIIKKYLNEEKTITAKYQVINKEKILYNIYESGEEFLDIDNIFINIPTPFKKGDILVTWSETPARDEIPVNKNNIFVLDYLCTWKDDLKELLEKGNYDSSDMIGYGYYITEDESGFILDHKWDYDSFEYYEGEFKGIHRTLKAISNCMKGKINLELLMHAYEEFKHESKPTVMNYYNEEGLKLAGCSECDILKYTRSGSKKIYNMPEKERMDYIKYQTDALNEIDEKEVKQIESNINNYVYVLLKNGDLYEDGKKIDTNIERIYMFDGDHLYKINKENQIIPLRNTYNWNNWDNTDKYLNNENCKYKKIVTSTLHILALTGEGNVRAIHSLPTGLGIEPENFKNVENITIVEDSQGIETPYIYKDKEYKTLYIE